MSLYDAWAISKAMENAPAYDQLLARLEALEQSLSSSITQAETAATGAKEAAREAQTAANAANTAAKSANTAASNANTAAAEAPKKADKVTNATNGNLAGLDATGNLTDSSVSSAGETWTFTLEDSSTLVRNTIVK